MSAVLNAIKQIDRNKAALFLSIVPGLGHIFKGYRCLGFALIAGNVVIAFIALWLAFATLGLSLFLLPALWWAGVVASAFLAEDRTSATPPPKFVDRL